MKMSKLILAFMFAGIVCAVFVSGEDGEVEAKADTTDEDDDFNDDDSSSVKVGDEDDGVIVLDRSNFTEFITNTELALVEFYAPWCEHCKVLAPEYSAAAKELKENDPPILLAKVDATVEIELAQEHDVGMYPTLKIFEKGDGFEYEGPRDKSGIVEYMKKRASPGWKPESEAVVVLTKDNFTDVVNREELMLVEFYAPWCGHCKQLAPKYENAAKQLKTFFTPIMLAKVDATQETELASKFGVTGYPTLKIFRKGKEFDYKGPREERGIVSYMQSQIGDPAKPVVGLKALKSFLKEDDISVLGFFDSETDPHLVTFQDSLLDIRDDYRVGFTVDETIRKEYKANTGSVLVLNAERYYTKFEPKWHIFQMKDDTTPKQITQFIKDHEFPLVGAYDGSLQSRYMKRSPLCLIFYTVDWTFDHRDATQLWRTKIAAIAKDFKGITFAVADEDQNSQLLKDIGLEDSSEEINIGILADGKKYRMDPMEEFDSDEIRDFLKRFQKGKVEPVIKSQPIPKKQQGSVTIVVGKTFDKIVRDPSKDVLIEFYAPWCGHCKKLEPIYADVAKKFKSVKNLIIAKMDATANDSPDDYKVEGFPTIYFAPTDNKDKPVKFEGERTLEGFESFLKEKSTVSLGKIKEEL